MCREQRVTDIFTGMFNVNTLSGGKLINSFWLQMNSKSSSRNDRLLRILTVSQDTVTGNYEFLIGPEMKFDSLPEMPCWQEYFVNSKLPIIFLANKGLSNRLNLFASV